MTDAPDADLLEQFVRDHSEAAFAALVERHIGIVHSVALRHTANSQHAQDITQVVFIILARKAAALSRKTILTGWLYHTARLVAANFRRAETRRNRRDQEVFMQSTLQESTPDPLWPEMSPLLDEAMSRLRASDRDALVLRYFQNKSLAEVGAVMGLAERTAQKRILRAIEKLRANFAKRGVTNTADEIVKSISANSVQAVSPALVKAVAATAFAKGATASASILTLTKGALKIMAWTKAKTAIAAGAVVLLLAAGTAIVAVEGYGKHNEHGADSWEIPTVYDLQHHDIEFDFSKPQVRIKQSIYPKFYAGSWSGTSNKEFRVQISRSPGGIVQTNYLNLTTYSDFQSIGLGVTLKNIVLRAYFAQPWQAVLLVNLPEKPLYDYVSNLPDGTAMPLRQLIEKQFGIVGKWETRETDVLLLKLSDSDVGALKPAGSLARSMNMTDLGAFDRRNGTSKGDAHFYFTMDGLIKELWLQDTFPVPMVDETGLTNQFDFVFKNPTWQSSDKRSEQQVEQQAWKDALANQLGLELVPARRPVTMLVVEKAK